MTLRAAPRASLGLALGLAALTAACQGSGGHKPDAPGTVPSASPSPSPAAQAEPDPEILAPSKKISERPFFTLTDSLDRNFFGAGFDPGIETLWSPFHQGVHASLYYVATRGAIPLHYHKGHEETLFVLEGEGSLVLPDRRVHLEQGVMVRLQPGVCHGWEGDRRKTLKAVVLVSPPFTEKEDDLVTASTDAPGTIAAPWVMDVTSTDALEALPTPPRGQSPSLLRKRKLDATKFSTVHVVAVRQGKIPDHVHEHHDETAIIFAKKGYAFVRANETVNVCEEGSIMHLPEGTVHSVEHTAEGHMRAVTIHTPGADETEDLRPVAAPKGNTPSADVSDDKHSSDYFRAPAPVRPRIVSGKDEGGKDEGGH